MIRRRNRRNVRLSGCVLTFNSFALELSDMRETEPDGATLYECVDCGDRQKDPEGRLCTCGGYLQNIGIERSL